MCRRYATSFYFGVKALVRRLVEANGGYEMAASLTRVDKARLSHYANVNRQEHIPIDVLADLQEASGDYSVLRFLANQAGFDLVARPSGQPVNTLADGISDLSRRAADVVGAMAQAVADGMVSPEEAEDVINHANALVAGGVNIIAHMRKVRGAGE